MSNLALIGIDCGLSGSISVLENGKLKVFRMKEEFTDILEIIKPYGGMLGDNRIRCAVEQLNLRPNQDPFKNARMEPMKINYNRVQDALKVCHIKYQLVSPQTWQKFHNLVLPKGEGERGLDYSILEKYKLELKHLQIHASIESKTPNHEIIVGNIRYILESSGRKEARKALCDEFTYLSLYDLNNAIAQTEKEIEKFYNHEKTIRKNRYKALAAKYAGRKVTLWEADSILILLYQKYNNE
jgi:hypothetical protein